MYPIYKPIMVTYFTFLNSNPGNSLAKLLFTADCLEQTTIRSLKTLQGNMSRSEPSGATGWLLRNVN